jgi:hypothetical protein
MLNIDQSRTLTPAVPKDYLATYPEVPIGVSGVAPAVSGQAAPLVTRQTQPQPTAEEVPQIPITPEIASNLNIYAGVLPRHNYRLTTAYGSPSASSNPALKGRGHMAIDIATPMGTPVYSPGYGIVTENEPGNGTMIVKYDNGNSMVLAHTKTRYYAIGERVRPGDMVALSGNTGDSTGPHLHLGIIDRKGNRLNPTNFYYGKENPFGQGADPYTIDTTSNTNTTLPVWGNQPNFGIDATKGNPAFLNLGISANQNASLFNLGTYNPTAPLWTGAVSPFTALQNPAASALQNQISNRQNTNYGGLTATNMGVLGSTPVYTAPAVSTPGVTPGTAAQLFATPSTPSATDTAINGVPMYNADGSLNQEWLKQLYTNVIEAQYGGSTNEDIYNRTIGQIPISNPAGAIFDPVNNPYDKAMIELGIVSDVASGKLLDRDVLDALRVQMAATLTGQETANQQLAQETAAQINQGQRTAGAFLGRNPGDMSQSTAGRLAINSFDRAANENISKANTATTAVKNALFTNLANVATNLKQVEKTRQDNLRMNKMNFLFNAAVADRDTARSGKAEWAAIELTVLQKMQELKANDATTMQSLQYVGDAMVNTYNNAISALQTELAAETDEAKKVILQDQINAKKASLKSFQQAFADSIANSAITLKTKTTTTTK